MNVHDDGFNNHFISSFSDIDIDIPAKWLGSNNNIIQL